MARLQRMADAVTILVPKPENSLVAGPRQGTERCSLMLAEVGLRQERQPNTEKAVPLAQRALAKQIPGPR